jgi:hypothetical protein
MQQDDREPDPFTPIVPDPEPFTPIEPDPDLPDPTDDAGPEGYGATPDLTEEVH